MQRTLLVAAVAFFVACSSGPSKHSDIKVPADLSIDQVADSCEDLFPEDRASLLDVAPESMSDVLDLAVPDDLSIDVHETDSWGDVADLASDLSIPFPPIPEGPALLANLQMDPPMLPFPWDWFTREVPGAASGLHLALDEPWRQTALLSPLFELFPGYREDAYLLDGFGSAGVIVLPFASKPALQALPSVTGPGEVVEVLHIHPAGPDASLPFRVTYVHVTDGNDELHAHVVQLEPVYPVPENSRLLVLVRKSLLDESGLEQQRPPLMDVILGDSPPYGPPDLAARMVWVRDRTAAALQQLDQPIDVQGLAGAMVYTTGTMTADLLASAALIQQHEIVVDLDPDGDGQDNIVPAADYYGNPPANMATVIHGRFETLDFRLDNGYLGPDEAGEVKVRSKQWRNFYLFIPEGEGPFPVAVVQHGLNAWKETIQSVSKELVKRGYAAAGFDFVHHSKENPNGGFWFLKVDVPRETVGNFRQSTLDMLTFFQALEVLSETVDVAPPGGNGQPDLDFARVVFTGHSLGAIMSSMACTLSSGERAAALVAGAGNFGYVFLDTLKILGLFNLVPSDALLGFTTMAEHFMSRADPMVFASMLKSAPHPDNGPCPFLLELGMQDETLPPASGEAMAFATGVPLLDPVEEPWDGIPIESAAGLDSGTIQFQGGHNFFFSGSSSAAAKGVYYHFVDTFMKTGVPELVWPQP